MSQPPSMKIPVKFRSDNNFEQEIDVNGVAYVFKRQKTFIVDKDGKRLDQFAKYFFAFLKIV